MAGRVWSWVPEVLTFRRALLTIVALSFLSSLCFISGCGSEGPADTNPPAPVTDLAVDGGSTCSVDLTWTAVGDDGVTGRASGYDIRYSTSAIVEATWDDAAQCQGEPSPSDAGEQEHFSVTGLAVGTKYYFRLTATDDNSNISELSNAATSETDSAGASPGVVWVKDGPGADDLDWTNAVSGLSATWAAMSSATGYEYAIGSELGTADLVGWRAVSGVATSVTHTGINLTEGRTYYFSVRAILDGGCSGHGNSDGITADHTRPESRVRALPGEVGGLGIRVNWTGSDGASGIAAYDVQSRDGESGAWTNLLVGTRDTTAVLDAEDGHTYFFRSRARDIAGNQEDYPATADAQTEFAYEMTEVAWVSDGLGPDDDDFTGSASEISAAWAAVTGADGYGYAVGTRAGLTDVVDWTDAGTATEITRVGLSLSGCRTYFFSVRVRKGFGVSAGASSDGVTVDVKPPESQVAELPDTLRTANTGGLGSITIRWGGTDRTSGIQTYDVQYRHGESGAWTDLLLGTSLTTTAVQSFSGPYEFRCRAIDRAGNLEAYPSQPDARTYLAQGGEVQPPPPDVPSHLYDLKLALHLAPHSAATSCKSLPAISSRGDLVRSWPSPGTELDAFIVIFAYDSLATFDYGLDWPAEWGSASTQTCADFTIGHIYGPGDGLSLGWNSCKVRGEAPAFSPVAWTWMAPWTNGSIWITHNPTFGPDEGLGGYDCRGAEHARFHHPDSLFCAAVGTDPFEGAWCGASAMGCIRALFK